VTDAARGNTACATILCENARREEWGAEGENDGRSTSAMASDCAGIVAFLLFGAKRLPELGKGLGEGLKGFKEGIKGVTIRRLRRRADGAAERDSATARRLPRPRNRRLSAKTSSFIVSGGPLGQV
jgi:TatA/E family protein of Tat protein translocase